MSIKLFLFDWCPSYDYLTRAPPILYCTIYHLSLPSLIRLNCQTGGSWKVAQVSLTARVLLSIQIEPFAWSAAQLISNGSSNNSTGVNNTTSTTATTASLEARRTIDLYPRDESGRSVKGVGVGMTVCTLTAYDELHTAHIRIFR